MPAFRVLQGLQHPSKATTIRTGEPALIVTLRGQTVGECISLRRPTDQVIDLLFIQDQDEEDLTDCFDNRFTSSVIEP